MSFVGAGIVGQRLDQPTKLLVQKEQPLIENIQKEHNMYNFKNDDEEENNYPRPLEFEKMSEKIDYFDAIKNIHHSSNYQGTLPQPLQPKKINREYKKPKFQAQKPKIEPKITQQQKEKENPIYGKHLDKKPKIIQEKPQNQQQKQKISYQNNKNEPQKTDNLWKHYVIEEQSDTESHACDQCICGCYNIDGDLISEGGESQSCACNDCGQIYAQVLANYKEKENDFQDLQLPTQLQNFNSQQQEGIPYMPISEKQQYTSSPNKNNQRQQRQNQLGAQKYNNQIQQNKNQIDQQRSLSPSPPPTADIQTQIQHQQKKVQRIQQKMENEKQQLQKNKQITKKAQNKPVQQQQTQQQKQNIQKNKKEIPQKKPVNNNKYNQKNTAQDDIDKLINKPLKNIREDDNDMEQPSQYGIAPQKQPVLGRITVASAQEIATRNNLLYKQKKEQEKLQKEREEIEKKNKKQQLKQYSQQVKQRNHGKIHNGKKKPTDHKYAWGVDQSALEKENERQDSKEKPKSLKPEAVTKYNDISNFFDNVPSNWLNNIQKKVKNELKEIKRPKSLPRRKSLDDYINKTEHNNEDKNQNQKFNYLRSKSNKNFIKEPIVKQSDVQREEQAYNKLILEKKRKKKEEEREKKKKLQKLQNKQKQILKNTKMVKFVPEDEEGDQNNQDFGNRSMSRFNMKNNEDRRNHQEDDEEYEHFQANKNKNQQQNQEDTEFLDDPNQLKYDKYKSQYKEEYDDGYQKGAAVEQVFGEKVPPRTYRANERLVIGFQNKSEQPNTKGKNIDPSVQWSKDKQQREITAKKQIIAKEGIDRLKEEREQRKLEKQAMVQEKIRNKDQYDEDGFNIQTREYDPFYDKSRPQNYLKENEEKAEKSDDEYENQLQQQKNELNNLSKSNNQNQSLNNTLKYNQQQQQQFSEQYNTIDKYNSQYNDYNPNVQNNQQQNNQFPPVNPGPYSPERQQQYSQFEQQQHYQQQYEKQQQVQQLINNKHVRIQQTQPMTTQEQQLRAQGHQIRILDKKGQPLPQHIQNQLFNEGELQDLPQGVRQQQQDEFDQMDDEDGYYQNVENQIKKQIWSRKDEKISHKKGKYDHAMEPLELRKRKEWERQQGEVNKLKKPSVSDLFEKDGLGLKFKNQDNAEDWGEYDGIELKGTKPYWDEVRGLAQQQLNENNSDSDIYEPVIKEKKQTSDPYDSEVLERIERFNDYKVQKNLQQGKHKRIPIEKSELTYYKTRCKEQKQTKQEYKRIAQEFEKNNKFDSDEEEGFKKRMHVEFNDKNDRIFAMGAEDILRLDHFEIQ